MDERRLSCKNPHQLKIPALIRLVLGFGSNSGVLSPGNTCAYNVFVNYIYKCFNTLIYIEGNFMNEFLAVIKNYAGFSGRAGRREFWMFYLVYILIIIAVSILGAILPSSIAIVFSILILVFSLAMLIPTLAVGVRRLHDTDHSGWWLLISLIPFAGLYILYLFIIEGTQGSNRFGDSPVAMIANAV
jgi:uncharacterized membrane protein YhaH (DUF805 family)